MKRAITIVATAMFALLPLAAAGSESFTLTIPKRFDAQQEIGEVRILLGLNAAPAGSQLVVNGSTTINLGATQTVGGDSISFATQPNNRVLIRYRPLSNFSGDFCQGANAVEKNIEMRFVGAQDVVDYRTNSFVVGAPAVECSDIARRIADLPATITPNADGVAPALDAVPMGRLAIDVVLVLDKSGSIADLPPDAGPNSITTKEQILKSAASTFVANWEAIDAPTGGVNWDDDRIGLLFFDNVATPQTMDDGDPPADFFLRRSAGWGDLVTAIGGLLPGNSTSIGAGINAGMEQWKADPAHDMTMVVVTDGMQNTAPLVAPAGSGFLALPPVSGLPNELRKRFIPIQTIGFGIPAAVDETLLRNISLETAGRSYISINATTMYDTFAMTLVSFLKGNTASIATRDSSSLTAVAPTATRKVIVDKSARRIVLSLQWTPPLENAFSFEVMRPNSTIVATPTSTRSLPQASLQTFDLEKPEEGVWQVRVRRNPKLRDRGATSYTLNVFFLERNLDYRLSVTPERINVGDQQHLRAEISYRGRPLTGLPDGAIRVRALKPKASLEAVLRRTKGKPRRETPGDPQSAQQHALSALTPSDIALLMPTEGETLTMKEEKRGVYTVSVPKSTIAGSYAFEFVLDWTDPRTGHVHREERLEQSITARK